MRTQPRTHPQSKLRVRRTSSRVRRRSSHGGRRDSKDAAIFPARDDRGARSRRAPMRAQEVPLRDVFHRSRKRDPIVAMRTDVGVLALGDRECEAPSVSCALLKKSVAKAALVHSLRQVSYTGSTGLVHGTVALNRCGAWSPPRRRRSAAPLRIGSPLPQARAPIRGVRAMTTAKHTGGSTQDPTCPRGTSGAIAATADSVY
jgi:hypothetical protein